MTEITLRGDRIRALRERLGWSQRELGEKSGIGLQQIHRYESGKSDPLASALKAVAQQLGVTTDYLLGLSDDPHTYAAMELTEDARRLVEAYESGDAATILSMILDRMPKMLPPRED